MRGRIRELQRLDAILNGCLRLLSVGERVEEMRHLVGIRDAIALHEKMVRCVLADINGAVREYFGRLVISRLQHAFAAEDLEALIVAVGRAAASVDLRDPAATGANDYRGGIDIPDAPDRRVGEATAGREQRQRFVVEYPAENIKVVDQHVLEDPSRRAQVLDGWRTRVAAGDYQHFGLADLAGGKPRLQRRERRIEPALKTDHASDTGLAHCLGAGAGAHQIEIDRLLAEDGLAGGGAALDQLRMRVGAGGNDDGGDRFVGKDRVRGPHFGAMLDGEIDRGHAVDVSDVFESDARLTRQIAGVNAADADCSK